MVTIWLAAVGVVIIWALIFFSSPTGNDLSTPWDDYHQAFNDAQVARGEFLRSGFITASRSLKDRICCQVRKLHLPHCPLCCATR